MVSKKECPKCKSHLEATKENFYYLSHVGRLDNTCKDCRKRRMREHSQIPEIKERESKRKATWYRQNRDKVLAQSKIYAATHVYRRWAINTKYKHEMRGIKVLLSVDELEGIVRTHTTCMLCGVQLSFGNKKVLPASPTVDRLNNDNYIDGNNIFIVCHRCNATKQDRTMQEFINYCIEIGKRFNKKSD
jgi:hypothetical protein